MVVQCGRLRIDGFVAGTVTLDELPTTIDDLANRRIDAVKLLVDPSAGSPIGRDRLGGGGRESASSYVWAGQSVVGG